ncbi:hypothetical protein S245_018125 [Arachis hypogaea]
MEMDHDLLAMMENRVSKERVGMAKSRGENSAKDPHGGRNQVDEGQLRISLGSEGSTSSRRISSLLPLAMTRDDGGDIETENQAHTWSVMVKFVDGKVGAASVAEGVDNDRGEMTEIANGGVIELVIRGSDYEEGMQIGGES